MSQRDTVNRRIVLVNRPGGLPTTQDVRLEETAVPAPGEGQVLLRTLYLSLDPYMRNLMDEAGTSYAPPVALGAPMVGGTVSRVAASRHPQFRVGEVVLGNAGWQDYAVSDGKDLQALGEMAQPSLALGGLGMPAFTAYVGLLDIGQPQAGETVVVAAATGAVGSVVGQIAKLKGTRVVGIAGGADKCRHAVEELGFDLCLDRHDPQLAEQLAAACPDGIDVYFENVGGAVWTAVCPLLNDFARVPVCGLVSHYNETVAPAGPDRLPGFMNDVLKKSLTIRGFIQSEFVKSDFKAFVADMSGWMHNGRIAYREDIVEGLENAPAAFNGMLAGRNFGKLIIKVAEAGR
jgi:NADPH-dependent curcumin reductase CurA